VNVWENVTTPERRLLKTLEANGDNAVEALAFSADGKVLAAGRYDGVVQLWDTRTWALAAYYSAADSEIISLSFSGDSNNRNLLINLFQGEDAALSVKIWDTSRPPSEEMPQQSKNAHGNKLWPSVVTLDAGRVSAAAFSHGGKTIATSGVTGEVRLWDALARDEEVGADGARYAVARRELATIKKAARKGDLYSVHFYRLAFSPDDRMLFGGDSAGFVWLWRGVTESEIEAQRAKPPAAAAASR
jgi:WD40 repeat protein